MWCQLITAAPVLPLHCTDIRIALWDPAMPFVVRCEEISGDSLNAPPPNCYADPAPGTCSFGMQTPLGIGQRATRARAADRHQSEG
jgi:hypothetical protein